MVPPAIFQTAAVLTAAVLAKGPLKCLLRGDLTMQPCLRILSDLVPPVILPWESAASSSQDLLWMHVFATPLSPSATPSELLVSGMLFPAVPDCSAASTAQPGHWNHGGTPRPQGILIFFGLCPTLSGLEGAEG